MQFKKGFYPFWFWNDRLEPNEIKYQVKEMADKGIKGFFIHSRQGLKQPYLSESFFEMIDVTLEVAKDYNMVVNLYDEYPYPSGIAGGQVVMDNYEYSATTLQHQTNVVQGGSKLRLKLPYGKILSAKAFPYREKKIDWNHEIELKDYIGMVLDEDSYNELQLGLTEYNKKRYFSSNPKPVVEVELPPGKYKLFVTSQIQVKDFKYWGNYVDVLNRQAINKFIDLTHERYRQRYQAYFGNLIQAIFTDEVQPDWSSELISAFENKYGYDICDHLPALHDNSHPNHIEVNYDFYNLQYEIFCASFEHSVQKWCHNNNLAYTGEKPALRLSQLKYMDITGCDSGHIKAGDGMDILQAEIRCNAKAVASAAYLYDKKGSLCECYHSIGWSATLQDAKLIAEELLLLGIDYLVPHGFFYSTHGLRKHDAPPSFFYQMPYWPLFVELTERVEKINEIFKGTYIDAELLVVDPHSGIPDNNQLKIYKDILSLLMGNHISFHIVDTDILQKGKIKDGSLYIKDLEISLVILPPMKVTELPLQEWLENFENEGGDVIYCENKFEFEEFNDKLNLYTEPELKIKNKESGKNESSIWIVKRKSKDKTIWFVLNTGAKKINCLLESKCHLEEIPINKDLTFLKNTGKKRYERVIMPFESFVLKQRKEKKEIKNRNFLPIIEVPVEGNWEISYKNKNLLRMYDWKMSLLDDNKKKLETKLVTAAPLSNQLKEGGFSFKPNFKTYFGNGPELKFPELLINYDYTFLNNFKGKVELVIEPDSIKGEWSILINQSEPIVKEDFSSTDAHTRGSVGKDISNLLKQGQNLLQVQVKANKANHGMINPLYLAGKFGVSSKNNLVEQKKQGKFEEYKKNLVPYYSGVLEYSSIFTLKEKPETEKVIIKPEFDEYFHQATKISINNSQMRPVAWEPRCFELSTKFLNTGKNIIKIRVYTSLIRSFEGKKFDYEKRVYCNINE